jgi:hypothetical protein
MTEQLTKQVAEALNEANLALIRRIITVIGAERTQAFLTQTQEKLAKGGLLRKDGEPRTAGGVFFYLVRGAISKEERKQLFPYKKKPKRLGQANAKPQAPGLTWQAAIPFIAQVIQSIGEAKTVKITLIGRPGNVVQQPTCVLVSMKGKEPGSLPKGLPAPPEGSAITWAVFIVNKQWAKVSESVQNNADDQLIVEGYPVVDAKRGVGVVLASSCKSVLMDRAAPTRHPEAKAKG